MFAGEKSEVLKDTLLHRYLITEHGNVTANYTDCYQFSLEADVSLADFIEAFYTSRLFRFERMLLGIFMRMPSTDEDAVALARCKASQFSAWTVEAQTDNELLLSDVSGATRSWLMVKNYADNYPSISSQLWFGSAVVARINPKTGKAQLSVWVQLLLGFHKLYSRALMASARSKLQKMLSNR